MLLEMQTRYFHLTDFKLRENGFQVYNVWKRISSARPWWPRTTSYFLKRFLTTFFTPSSKLAAGPRGLNLSHSFDHRPFS